MKKTNWDGRSQAEFYLAMVTVDGNYRSADVCAASTNVDILRRIMLKAAANDVVFEDRGICLSRCSMNVLTTGFSKRDEVGCFFAICTAGELRSLFASIDSQDNKTVVPADIAFVASFMTKEMIQRFYQVSDIEVNAYLEAYRTKVTAEPRCTVFSKSRSVPNFYINLLESVGKEEAKRIAFSSGYKKDAIAIWDSLLGKNKIRCLRTPISKNDLQNACVDYNRSKKAPYRKDFAGMSITQEIDEHNMVVDKFGTVYSSVNDYLRENGLSK